MLRRGLFVIGVLCLLWAGVAASLSCPASAILPVLLPGLALTVGILVERVIYKPLGSRPPGPGWTATGERFVDPTSGRLVRVFDKTATGERQYVDDGPPP